MSSLCETPHQGIEALGSAVLCEPHDADLIFAMSREALSFVVLGHSGRPPGRWGTELHRMLEQAPLVRTERGERGWVLALGRLQHELLDQGMALLAGLDEGGTLHALVAPSFVQQVSLPVPAPEAGR